MLFHPLPYISPTQLVTKYLDLLFPDVQDMVSAECSTLVFVRLLFNMHFTNIDLLGRTGLKNVSSGAWEQLPLKGSLPRRGA